jgi:RHS repeat-associated protein
MRRSGDGPQVASAESGGGDQTAARGTAPNDSFLITPPALSLPKGGGAIRGLGEKFAANPVTGTGSMTVPIATSPGRSGFGPQLSLAYDSGAGNGPFGLGWNLSLPSITRKTDKGLPTYVDLIESDTFILAGAEDLVPELVEGGGWRRPTPRTGRIGAVSYDVVAYRPRVEGAFARIERWASRDGRDMFWRTLSRDNVTTFYGRTTDSRIVDPSDPRRIFSWLICETNDDKGNVAVYEYKRENVDNVDRGLAPEGNRRDDPPTANTYIKRIKYGNTPSRLVNDDPSALTWHFEVVFDYDDGHYREAAPDAAGRVFATATSEDAPGALWPVRADPFSRYRAGFEVRTYRLCKRVLMFHRFSELGPDAVLVSSTELDHLATPSATYLQTVTHAGFVAVPGNGLLKRTLPPLALEYSLPPSAGDLAARPLDQIRREELANLPAGISGNAQWVDLDGEGLSGVLSEHLGAWYYKRNLGSGRFGPLQPVAPRPTVAERGTHRLMDLAGDGHLDVVVADAQLAGVIERTPDDDWGAFRAFAYAPNVSWRDPNVRFFDLTGDGLADLVVSEQDAFVWYRSMGEDGFAPAERVSQLLDEERGPRVMFADGTQTLFLGDMTGDGLTDLVRIRAAEICYWPNLGYGRFGRKVTMASAPVFDQPECFDPDRIRLADLDGSGVMDIVYFHGDGPVVYFNQSGNSWSAGRPLPQFPRVDNVANVQALDLLGSGTTCLVWSSPLPGDEPAPLRYIDLMGGVKPHLLKSVSNNLGGKTSVEYAPSTRFYLEDREAGRPWITRLPFPVHVVARTIVEDLWRGTRFSSTYSYHHGHYGDEREFRGFARVDAIDVEAFGLFAAGNVASPYITADQTLYQPPVKTVTWYHTGAAIDRRRILSQLSSEYFPARFPSQTGFNEKPLPEPELDQLGLHGDEWKEAARACKGMVLRQEVYELDVDTLASAEPRPVRLFSAATHNFTIKCVQPRGPNRHAVFMVTESEALSYQYELDLTAATLPPDPRIAHTLNLSFDDFGNVQQTVAVGYARRGQHPPDATLGAGLDLIRAAQAERHVAYNEVRYTRDSIDPGGPAGDAPPDFYRLRQPSETLAYEVTGLSDPTSDYFDIDVLRSHAFSTVYPPLVPVGQPGPVSVTPLAYHQRPTGNGVEARLVEQTRKLYWKDDLSGAADLNELGQRALPYETYKLALTRDLLIAVFGAKLNETAAPGKTAIAVVETPTMSGYVRPVAGTDLARQFGQASDDDFWMRSGIPGFAPDAADHFFMPERYEDPFGGVTTLRMDGSYDLFVRSTSDARGNTAEVTAFDYRVQAPRELTDVNGNRTEVRFDGLGSVVATALKGKATATEGDTLAGFDQLLDNPPTAAVAAFCTSAVFDETKAREWLLGASARFVYHFGEAHDTTGAVVGWAQKPAGACGIRREVHVSEPGGTNSPLQVALECLDGAGGVLMTKAQAEPAPGSVTLRRVINGKTVLNNKGKPVKQYEPYFSDRFGVEPIDEVGVTPLMYYDAPGRLVRTELPDGSLSRVTFSPWDSLSYDANDTVLESSWYQDRGAPDPTQPLPAGSSSRTRAAWLAAQHAGTPSLTVLDSLARPVVTVAHNRAKDAGGVWGDEKQLTFTKLDAEGKPLWIQDARGNLVMRYTVPRQAGDDPTVRFFPAYDVAGNLLYQHSMDGGDRWLLNDAAGKPLLGWDENERQVGTALVPEERLSRVEYDELHRPVRQWLRLGATAAPVVVEQFEYVDAADNDAAALANNLQGQLVRHYDPNGLGESVRRDFKGNTLEARRRLTSAFTASVVDWQGDLPSKLEPANETFAQITEYDGLNRMTKGYGWHRGVGARVAVYEPSYNARGALSGESLTVRATKTTGAAAPGPGTTTAIAIAEIQYDAKGQRTFMQLGNGTVTLYDYDPQTFRLRQLRTTRAAAGAFPAFHSGLQDTRVIQQLSYEYDPGGNIVEIDDEAYEPVFFKNQVVLPRSLYEYDAIYRLTSATGRESRGLGGAPTVGESIAPGVSFPLQASDPNALQLYTQTFNYDAVGNILRIQHVADAGGWTRYFQPATDSNRLVRTWEGDPDPASANVRNLTNYAYDIHGNSLNVANVAPGQYLRWDHRDMIASLDLVGGGWAYYQYDSSKQRTRKRLERDSRTVEERIYLSGYELYRRYNPSGAVVEEIDSIHLMAGDQRVLLVDDVIAASGVRDPRPDGLTVPGQTLFRYQYTNHLGSACLELDDAPSPRIISYEEYHPYGTSAYRAANSQVDAPPKRYRYTGMERDEESGLNHHGVRYLSVVSGRWLSTDPIGPEGGLHLYRYASCNPIRSIDTTGLSDEPKTGHETRSVSPQAKAVFPANTLYEVYVRLLDPKTGLPLLDAEGNQIIQRIDALIPPQNEFMNEATWAEFKGKPKASGEPSTQTPGQKVFHPQTKTEQGAFVEVISENARALGLDRVFIKTDQNFMIIDTENLASVKEGSSQVFGRRYTFLRQVGDEFIIKSFDTHQQLAEFLESQGIEAKVPETKIPLSAKGGSTPGPESGGVTIEGALSMAGVALTGWAIVNTYKTLQAAAQASIENDDPNIYLNAFRVEHATWGAGLATGVAFSAGQDLALSLGLISKSTRTNVISFLASLAVGFLISATVKKLAEEEVSKETRALVDPTFAAKREHIEAFQQQMFGF